MRRSSSLLVAALLAATACAEQAASPAPRPLPQVHPTEDIWRQEYSAEFNTADKDGDGRLDKAESAAFLDLVEAKRRQAAPPALPVAVPPTPGPVPGPSIGVMLPPLRHPLDQEPAAAPRQIEVAVIAPPPIVSPANPAPDPQVPPAGMTILVVPIPLPAQPPEEPRD